MSFPCFYTLHCLWSSHYQSMGWPGPLSSLLSGLSASHSLQQQLLLSCRHYTFAHVLPFAEIFFLLISLPHPAKFQSHLRFSSGSFLHIIPKPSQLSYGLTPEFAMCCGCLCHLPPNDGNTCLCPA